MPWIDAMIVPVPGVTPYPARTPDMIQKMFESFPSRRVFKTHLPYDLVPQPCDQATKPHHIYVMRNPKDNAVSLYHHFLKFPGSPFYKPSWDEFFESFFKGEGTLKTIFVIVFILLEELTVS